jgi:hypothetical protein
VCYTSDWLGLNVVWWFEGAFTHATPWFGVLAVSILVSTIFVGATFLLAVSFWRGFSLLHTAV